jgi:hypothetical protein
MKVYTLPKCQGLGAQIWHLPPTFSRSYHPTENQQPTPPTHSSQPSLFRTSLHTSLHTLLTARAVQIPFCSAFDRTQFYLLVRNIPCAPNYFSSTPILLAISKQSCQSTGNAGTRRTPTFHHRIRYTILQYLDLEKAIESIIVCDFSSGTSIPPCHRAIANMDRRSPARPQVVDRIMLL